jgi:hypothetical protein
MSRDYPAFFGINRIRYPNACTTLRSVDYSGLPFLERAYYSPRRVNRTLPANFAMPICLLIATRRRASKNRR